MIDAIQAKECRGAREEPDDGEAQRVR